MKIDRIKKGGGLFLFFVPFSGGTGEGGGWFRFGIRVGWGGGL